MLWRIRKWNSFEPKRIQIPRGAEVKLIAHFRLLAPTSWIQENQLGDPQKLGPCGGTSADPGKPTDAVTNARGGEKLPDGVILYRGAAIPEIDCEKLTYFALSVIWRAAVHEWRNGPRTVKLELGPYLEPLRQYLNGEAPFPENTIVGVRVSSLSDYAPVVNLPVTRPAGTGLRVHASAMLGLTFLIAIGKTLDVSGQPNLWPSPDHFIGVVPEIDNEDQQRALERYNKALSRGFTPK